MYKGSTEQRQEQQGVTIGDNGRQWVTRATSQRQEETVSDKM